jgi:hypothetical protein
MDIMKQKLDLRLSIYFGMTLKQQRAFNSKYSWPCIDSLSVNELKRYTKNKALLNKLVELKRLNIRVLEAA